MSTKETINENEEYANLNSVKQYMKEISRYPLLTDEEEKDIFARIANGDPTAAETLINSNLRLVVSVARHYATCSSMPLLDLIQEGNLGLIRAVEKFDISKGYKFSTYATWWIRQSISRSISDLSRTIRIPANLIETASKISKISREYEQMTGEDPSVEYLVEKSGEERKTIERILSIVKDPISLDSPVNEDDNTVGDLIPDEESEKPGASLIAEANREIVQNVLNTLDDRERKIITLRYGIGTKQPLTLEEVGNILGLTKERIRQIETNTLRKLRNPVRQMMLKEYFA